jgi:hypothetical protein
MRSEADARPLLDNSRLPGIFDPDFSAMLKWDPCRLVRQVNQISS